MERRPVSVHVNFRIAAAYKAVLEEEASKRDMHLNALVNHILAKFIFFGSIIEESNRVVFQKDFLTRIIPLISSDDFDEIARTLAIAVLKPAITFSGMPISMNDLVKNYFLPMGMYSGWFQARIVKTPSEYKLILQHEYGPKWTAFLKEYYSVAIKSLALREVSVVAADGILEISYR